MTSFQGTVKYTKVIDKLRNESELLDAYLTSFKTYWKDGYSPNIGKDIATYEPNPPQGHRHTHLKPTDFDYKAKAYSDSKDCWERWEKSQKHSSLPTSNTFLFYMVDTNRVAYVFHFLDEGSHEYLNTTDFREKVIEVADKIQNGGNELMSFEEQSFLFEKRWLESKKG